MAQKKHPILTVAVILCVVALFLGITMVIVLKLFSPSSILSFGDKIGVIPIDGTITQSIDITTELVRLKKDTGIKAIILRINSPGGSVGPTQEIYREIRKTIQTKKVVASMGSVAASGGYYIAAGADKIVANPGTITGSIGVIMHFVRLEELLNKIGIGLEVLKSGEFKDIGSPNRELTEREKELLNALIADIQRQFEEGVAEGRNLPLEKVRQIADGRIFSGAQAKELGLVDVLGNFQDAVEIAKNLAGIKGDVTLVYPENDKLKLWDLVFEAAAGSVSKLIQRMKTRVEYRWDGFAEHRAKESY
ncbi:MAG: signal peptide peptidase SppA [Deltaproteobacteria bacterium]|nr:signal peptide peptidase SppA [Deltaproteobacteria bacterium]